MKPEMERVLRSKEQARKSYNFISRWYDLFTSSEKRFTDIGIKMLNVKPDETVLEIGCGTGYALIQFANRGAKVIAIDLSEKMLDIVRRKIRGKNLELCQTDGLFLPFPKEQFETVFISFTLELFDTPEIPRVLSECHRILKTDGRLGIVSLAKQDVTSIRIYEWFHRQMPILVDCRPIYLQPFLKDAGFQIQDSIVKTMWGLPVEIVTAKAIS